MTSRFVSKLKLNFETKYSSMSDGMADVELEVFDWKLSLKWAHIHLHVPITFFGAIA